MVSEPPCKRSIIHNRPRLNPCFSGGWSRSVSKNVAEGGTPVGLNPCFSGGWSRSNSIGKSNSLLSCSLNPCFSGGWSRRATFGSVCQRDCCNDIFNFVNVWRPKICTFSGVITDANLRIFGECEHVFREYFGVFLGRCRIKKVGT